MHNLLHFVIRRLCSGDSASCPPLADAKGRIRCCIAMQQLLHGDKAIAAWRCSNELSTCFGASLRAWEGINKVVVRILYGRKLGRMGKKS